MTRLDDIKARSGWHADCNFADIDWLVERVEELTAALRDIQYTIDGGGPYDMGWLRDRAELAADALAALKEGPSDA